MTGSKERPRLRKRQAKAGRHLVGKGLRLPGHLCPLAMGVREQSQAVALPPCIPATEGTKEPSPRPLGLQQAVETGSLPVLGTAPRPSL